MDPLFIGFQRVEGLHSSLAWQEDKHSMDNTLQIWTRKVLVSQYNQHVFCVAFFIWKADSPNEYVTVVKWIYIHISVLILDKSSWSKNAYIVSLELTCTHTHIHIPIRITLIVRWVLVCITVVGFIILDIAYAAVLVNYCLQCQLLIYYFTNIGNRIKAKEWSIDQAIKVRRDT